MDDFSFRASGLPFLQLFYTDVPSLASVLALDAVLRMAVPSHTATVVRPWMILAGGVSGETESQPTPLALVAVSGET